MLSQGQPKYNDTETSSRPNFLLNLHIYLRNKEQGHLQSEQSKTDTHAHTITEKIYTICHWAGIL